MSNLSTPLKDRAARLQLELAAVQRVQETLETLRSTFEAFPALRDDFAAELRLLASGEVQGQGYGAYASAIAAGYAAPNGLSYGLPPESAYAALLGDKSPLPKKPTGNGVPFGVGTNRQRIEAFLASRDNAPATIEEITKATAVPGPSIRHLFSTRFPGSFEAVEIPGERLKHWRMRKPRRDIQMELAELEGHEESSETTDAP